MLPDELITTIETLKQRMADHNTILQDNETRTRMALVDPLLQALGWDTTDPFLVIPEYVIGDGQVDYALLSKKGGPTAVIEAKHFEEPLQKHRDKTIDYAKDARIKYAAITNGDQWQLYDVSGSGSLAEKQILDVRISASPPYQSALSLLLLWRPNLTSEQPVRTENPTATVQPGPDPSSWTSLAKFSFRKGKECPKTIRFLDRTEYPVHHWYDLALRTAQWLWSNRLLTEDDFSDFSSELRHLVHTETVHPCGNEFFNPKPVPGTCLFLEANMSGDRSLKKTKELLEGCGQSPAFVQLQQ
ncbi:MAG: type I restriction enzyme HsdR N-terminal domain-containing protein [Caldilineaceae bacterium]|nr:type I restriction enzyme HsdR N-terminal domain-containing protein [Caldilineaceae bacterium]